MNAILHSSGKEAFPDLKNFWVSCYNATSPNSFEFTSCHHTSACSSIDFSSCSCSDSGCSCCENCNLDCVFVVGEDYELAAHVSEVAFWKGFWSLKGIFDVV